MTALVIVSLLLVIVSPPAQALPYAQELRSWTAIAAGANTDFLKLEKGEEFDNYIFRVYPADGKDVAVGIVEVTNLHGDLECRGLVTYHFGLLSVVRHCPDLRIEHRYELTWTTDHPDSRLHLMGH